MSKKPKKLDTVMILAIGLVIISAILTALAIFCIYNYNLLNFRNLNLIVSAMLMVFVITISLLLFIKQLRWFVIVILMLFVTGTTTGLFIMKSFVDVSAKMNVSASMSIVEMMVIVPKNSEIKNIKQVDTLLTPNAQDMENITEFLKSVTSKNKNIELVDTQNYMSAYEELLEGQADAMVLNGAYASLIEGLHSDYKDKIRVIYDHDLKTQVKKKKSTRDMSKIKETIDTDKEEVVPLPTAQPTNSENTSVNTPTEVAQPKPRYRRTITDGSVLNVYISGVDTYGPISTVSRSDVNILMTINRNTNQILLTTTPRDSYVAIAGGGQWQGDKLTHAGIYGVDASIGTLENLYDIPIDYYARINFTSFLKLIDVLGGITVENDQAFSADGYDFPVGPVDMDSKMALRFVRERYQLAHGDNDRGRNQTKVIAAIIKKLTSFDAIVNYQNIISGIGDAIQTDMPFETMMNLANDQLASGRSYNITSQSLEGYGSTGKLPSFAMPRSALYMLEIDQNSLATITANIQNTMEAR